MTIKQRMRNLIYTLTRRVTYKEALKIKELADTYMTGCTFMYYEDIVEKFPNEGITPTYIPKDIEDRIDRILSAEADRYLSIQIQGKKDVKSKLKKFLLKNIRMFYFNRTDWNCDEEGEEFINYVTLELNSVKTRDLIGSRYR